MIRKKEYILNGVFIIFAIFPIIPNNFKGLPVILLFLAAIFFYDKSKINCKWLIINSSLFIVYLISLLYSRDYTESFKKLETALSILIIPISFFVQGSYFKTTDRIRLTFIEVFVISTGLFSITSFIYIIFNNSSLIYKWSTDRYRNVVMDMPVIGQHPIYASIFLSLAIIFFIYIIKNILIKSFLKKLFFLSVTIVNLTLLIILISKGVVISLCLVIFFLIAFSKIKKTYKYLLLCIMVVSLITLFIFNRRMNELINPQTYSKFNPNLSTSIRVDIYHCSLEIIKKEWLLGYGVGDAQRALNLCYANKNDILLMHRFNSHNQYLDVMIKTGLFGLLIFLTFLTINFRVALKEENEIMLIVLIFYSIIFLTENVLSRQSGVILFSFLMSFFNNSNKVIYNKSNDSKS